MARGRPPKYPWAEWLNDGERHILRQGTHFAEDVKVTSFRAECHAAARRKGGKVSTDIQGNSVVIIYHEDK